MNPAARGQFDPKVTPEERPLFQPWALDKMKSMTPTEVELSKSSVNCMPRGLPAIWLQNPYSTDARAHAEDAGAALRGSEQLAHHSHGRPAVPKNPEPWFHGTSAARWEGDTLVVDSIGIRRTDLRQAQRVVPQRRAAGHRALHAVPR